MTPDCYEFYLWSIGALVLPMIDESDLIEIESEGSRVYESTIL